MKRQEPKGTERDNLSEKHKANMKASAKKLKTDHNEEGLMGGEFDKVGVDAEDDAEAAMERVPEATSVEDLFGDIFAAETADRATTPTKATKGKGKSTFAKTAAKSKAKAKAKAAATIATMGFASMETPGGGGRGRGRGRGKKVSWLTSSEVEAAKNS